MNILYSSISERFIAYHKLNTTKKKAPCVIFHHGLMSNMDGIKALHIEKYCSNKGYDFIRFDNFGCGKASGKFVNECISTWLDGLNLVIDKLTDGPVLLVGSSAGAWVTMLSAIVNKNRVVGMIGLAPAPDFTEELIWRSLTLAQQEILTQNGFIEVDGTNPDCKISYPINFNLIKDGRKHLLLPKETIEISCPVHLIHGMRDVDVPHSVSQRVVEKLATKQVVLKLIKDADHGLSRPEDLQIICNSITELLK